jgi:hypothetical protein
MLSYILAMQQTNKEADLLVINAPADITGNMDFHDYWEIAVFFEKHAFGRHMILITQYPIVYPIAAHIAKGQALYFSGLALGYDFYHKCISIMDYMVSS